MVTKSLNEIAMITKDLYVILKQMYDLNQRINSEAAVCRAELDERLRLGLTGVDAIKHYNDYMDRFGMFHLKVDLS